MTDPRRAIRVAAAIGERLAALDPPNAAGYRERAAGFARRTEAALARWQGELAPYRGRPVLTQHRTFTYFFDWTGLVSAGELEPKPGTPAPPSHLAQVVLRAKRDNIRTVVVENYYDRRSADAVARHSGARVVAIPGDVGGEPDVKTYERYLDVVVERVAESLK
jgi:zinc/manganese transport system substrate-binding protein